MSDRITGRCLCGACEVHLSLATDRMNFCHCDMCRAGDSFASKIHGMTEAESPDVTGDNA